MGSSGHVFCAQEEERLLWFTQLCFYLLYCCFRDWLVDEGELGLKSPTRMSGSDNHLEAVNCKFDDGTEAVTDEIMCLSWFSSKHESSKLQCTLTCTFITINIEQKSSTILLHYECLQENVVLHEVKAFN